VSARGTAIIAAAVLLAIVAVSFFAATTFHGDDHIFLAYARHAPHPFVAFVSDAHGGEYYRPLPMMFWWLLGRAGGGSAPFAALALLLHAAAAALTARLVQALGRPAAVAGGAAVLMLLAPGNLDAASWFSASTDLFAAVFVLAALVALTRGRHDIVSGTLKGSPNPPAMIRGEQISPAAHAIAAAAALAAYLSKESACVLPLLALLVLRGRPWRRRLVLVAPHVALLAGVLVARTAVLHGWGGAGDARAGLAAKLLLQIPVGLARVFTSDGVLPDPLALGVGAAAALAAVAFAIVATIRARRAGNDVGGRWLPFAFSAIAAAPLLAAGWAVGARYFYLPAVGLAWAVAEALAAAGAAAQVTVAAVLLFVGGLQAAQRRADVVSYERRVAAARRVVAAGLMAGRRVFHIASGVKDLDLAVKEDRRLPPGADQALVLTDVPASFVALPPALAAAAAPLLAQPPLPPSGAYSFGAVRVVGLARRDAEPSIPDVLVRFPELTFFRLRPVPSGQIISRDVTDETRRALDGQGLDENVDGEQD